MDGVEAFIFDVFGTVVDWRSTVVGELTRLGEKYDIKPESVDWTEFAQEWRNGYLTETRRIASGGSGALNVDKMHREILDKLLCAPRWWHVGRLWGEVERQKLNQVWHRLNGWPDTVEGLYKLKKHAIIVTLSNGNVRLLLDMAKHADLPWDTIFSTELFETFKPDPKAYLSVIRHLSLPPEKCAMVAAHLYDLRAAASLGLKTVYIRRAEEDGDSTDAVRSKRDGGEVDVVVDSFLELAKIVRASSVRL